jgi:hypothetical protein
VHALQDQHANIDSLVSRRRGNDRQTAAHAALEGHATLVMYAWLAEEAGGSPVPPERLPDPAEQIAASFDAQADAFPVFQRAPEIIRRSLLFPYVGGAGFVRAFWLHRPPGADRIAPLGDALPQSTLQILEPVERFIQRRTEPLEIRFDDADPAWRVAYENTLGAFELRVLAEQHLGAVSPPPARGWLGDRYRLVHRPGGEEALVHASLWEDERAADEFALLLGRIAERAGRTARVERVRTDGRAGVVAVLTRGGVDPAAVPVPAWRSFASEADAGAGAGAAAVRTQEGGGGDGD